MDLTADVIYGDGLQNMGGIKKLAYIGLANSFTSLATPVIPAVTYGDLVKIVTPHVLATGKKIIKLYVMYDKSGVTSPSAGGRKQKSSKPKMTLMYPGNDAEILGLVTLLQNSDCICFAQPQDDTVGYIQVGTADLPATLTTYNVITGTTPEAEKGVTLEFEAPSRTPYYLYEAVLPLIGV